MHVQIFCMKWLLSWIVFSVDRKVDMFFIIMTGITVLPIAIGLQLLFPHFLQAIRDGETEKAGKVFANMCMCVVMSQYGFWGLFAETFLSK